MSECSCTPCFDGYKTSVQLTFIVHTLSLLLNTNVQADSDMPVYWHASIRVLLWCQGGANAVCETGSLHHCEIVSLLHQNDNVRTGL